MSVANRKLSNLFIDASDALYHFECLANEIAKDYYEMTGKQDLDDVTLMYLAMAYEMRKE